MKPQFLQYDTLDDRREVYCLLARLSPTRRLGYLRWCCSQAVVPNSRTRPGPARKTVELAELARRDSSADTRLTLDIFFDWWNLVGISYELDPDLALAKLVEMARIG